MTQKQSAIAASVQKASRGNPAFVFASSAEAMPKTATELTAMLETSKYARFGCKGCGTSVTSRADVTPFCITCGAGDGHVHQLESDVKASVDSKSNLVALNCSTCNTSTIMEEAVATAITSSSKTGPTPIHCSCCGNALTVVAEAAEGVEDPQKLGDSNIGAPGLATPEPAKVEAEGDDDLSLDDLGDIGGEGGDAVEDAGGDLPPEDGAPVAPAAVEGDPSTMTTPGAAVPPEQFAHPEPEDDLGVEDVLEVQPLEDAFTFETAEPMDFGGENGLGDDDGAEDFEAGADEDVSVLETEDEGDPLVDALDMDDTEQALAFVKAGARLVAMKGHVAVASISRKSKSVNASLADSPALQAAAKAAVQAEGLRAGLQSVGFSLIRVPMTSKAVVARRVQEVTAKSAATEANKQKVFAQSFALAAAGLNRGQWKGVTNPLRAAMETELARVGVEAPRRVAAAVFEAAGVAYAETLLSTSNRLSKMTAAARQDIAEVLNMTATVSPEEEHDEATGNPEAAPVESRFASGGKTTAALLRPRAEASAESVVTASSILRGNAPLSFSF